MHFLCKQQKNNNKINIIGQEKTKKCPDRCPDKTDTKKEKTDRTNVSFFRTKKAENGQTYIENGQKPYKNGKRTSSSPLFRGGRCPFLFWPFSIMVKRPF